MNISRLAHIGIAVRDLEQQIAFYRDTLGMELAHCEVVEDQKVRTAMFRLGETSIELLTPTGPDSPIAKFLEKRGEGIHHLAYKVDDLTGALAELTQRGVELLDKTPRVGAGGHRIAFLHPRSSLGVLTELCE